MPGLYGNGAGNVTVPAGSTSGLYQLSQDINVVQDTGYGNANVANYLASGALTSNVITSGNVQAGYFIGDGSQLTNIPGGNIVGGYGNANVVTLMANFGSNTVSTTGNITGGYILGNGSQLTGLPATYSNTNATSLLASFGSNTITTTGNITGGYFIGDGSQLTGLPASYGNANVATFLPTYTGNLAGGNLAVTNNSTVGGNLTVSGTIYGTFAGNISGNLVVPGANTEVIYNNNGNAGASSDFTYNDATKVLDVNGTANVNTLNASGNIAGGNINVPGGNILVGSYPTFVGYVKSDYLQAGQAVQSNSIQGLGGGLSLTTTGGSTQNITIGQGGGVGGNIRIGGAMSTQNPVILATNEASVTGNLTVSGNINGNAVLTDNYLYANGTPVSFAGTYGNANVSNFLANGFGSNTITTTGNITGGNFITSGLVQGGSGRFATAGSNVNITLAPSRSDIILQDGSGNTTLTSQFITTPGNITGANIIGNGQYLTNLPGANVTGTVANATYATSAGSATTATHATTANTVTDAAQANITSVGTLTGLTVGGDQNITGNLVIGQDLTVNGNTIYTNITELNVQDPIISQGRGPNNTPLVSNDGKDRGEQFWYYSGSEKSAFSGYDNSAGKMLLATDVSIANEIVTVNSLGNIVGGNIEATSVVTSGNVTASYVIGNGSALSSLTGANVSGTVADATHATIADSANSVTGGNVSGQVANALVAGTVYTNAQPNITSVGTLSSLSVTGNITGGNLVTTGNIYGNTAKIYTDVNGFAAYGSQNPASGGYVTNGAGNILIGGHPTLGVLLMTKYNEAGQTAIAWKDGNLWFNPLGTGGGNIRAINIIEAGGNITTSSNIGAINNIFTVSGSLVSGAVTYAKTDGTAGQVLTTYGNGQTYFSTVSGGSYGDSNVNTLLASWGSNTLSTTGNLTAGYFIGNGSALTSITGANVSGTVALATAATTAGTVTTAAQPNITSVGTLSSLSVTGNITSSANISGSYILGNGSQLTGIVSSYGNSNVSNYLSSGTNTANIITTGNITGGNLITSGTNGSISGVNYLYANVVSANSVTTTGKVIAGAVAYANTDGTAGQVLTTYGNGITYWATGGGSSYGDSNVVTLMSAFGSNTISTTGNITAGNLVGTIATASQPGITTVGTLGSLSVTGNITGGNVITTGTVKSGAVTITGTDGTAGQVLTTYGNGVTYFSTVSGGGGSPGGNTTEIQFNNAGSFAGNAAMTFSNTTGNISFGNLVIGNTGTSGTYYNVITSKNPFLGNSSTQPSAARILMGSGKNGDWSTTVDYGSNGRNARLVVADEFVKTDNGVRAGEISAIAYANLNGSTTYASANINSRIQGITSDVYVMNGNIVNTSPFIARGGSFGIFAGTGANTNSSNITSCQGLGAVVTTNTGSSIGTGVGMIAVTTGSGVITNQIGYGIQLAGNANSSGNAIGIYNPSSSGAYGFSNSNTARAATNYYFIKNDDPLAKNQIGQMNRYFDGYANCGGSSGGAVTIDANNGQFQYLNITEAVTSISFSNFLTYALAPSSSASGLVDTVSLIITQDATGRSITMPTSSGSNVYKYAGGTTTVSSTANSITMVSISAIYTGGTTTYLITISPEFS